MAPSPLVERGCFTLSVQTPPLFPPSHEGTLPFQESDLTHLPRCAFNCPRRMSQIANLFPPGPRCFFPFLDRRVSFVKAATDCSPSLPRRGDFFADAAREGCFEDNAHPFFPLFFPTGGLFFRPLTSVNPAGPFLCESYKYRPPPF